jgi:hypothetical protein
MVARSIGPTPWPAGGRRPRCACTSARRVDRAFCRRGRSCPPGVGPRTATNAGSTARSSLINDGYAFVKDIPSGQPEPPLYFATMKRVNRDGSRSPVAARNRRASMRRSFKRSRRQGYSDSRCERRSESFRRGARSTSTRAIRATRKNIYHPNRCAIVGSGDHRGNPEFSECRSPAQVEFVVIIGDESLHPLQRWCGLRVSGILFRNMLSPAIVGEIRNSLWNATMVRRRRARRAFTPRAGRSS